MFKDKTVLITGATRGIGKAIGIKLASEGANIILTGKTVDPHPKLPGTIYSAAEEMKKAGGNALPVVMDIQHEEMVEKAVAAGVKEFGGIDILVNNASAISLTPTELTPMKRYDLMHKVNVRGTFMASQKCLPYLKKADNPHILMLAPPLKFEARWFAQHLAYTMTKYGMSLCVLGMAEEFKDAGIGVNALWPRTTIATAAISNVVGGEEMMKHSRKPEIIADAAAAILQQPSKECTGNFFIDDEVLTSHGITDFDQYAVTPGADLVPDLFL